MSCFKIDVHCLGLLGLQQPMAGELRQIWATMWISGELGRTGGLDCNRCKGARRKFRIELAPKLRGLITEMNDEAIRLIRLSVDSYSEHDSALASALDDIDDRLDNLHSSFVQSLLEASSSQDLEVQAAVQSALVARYYGRIGDHAVNISERVRYMVSGEMPGQAELIELHLEESSSEPTEVPLNGEDNRD